MDPFSGAVFLSRTFLVPRNDRPDLRMHVNGKGLLVPLFFLREQSHLRDLHICFPMDNMVSIHCLSKLGSARSVRLQTVSVKLFHLASSRRLPLSAVHVPGVVNVWADAL